MDNKINNPFSGQEYIQYGKFTFKNVTDQLTKIDPATVDTSTWVKYDRTHAQEAAAWKGYFSNYSLSASPVSEVKQEIDVQADAAINGFFDGTVSEEELSETFHALAKKLGDACDDAGYPLPLQGITTIQARTESFYSEFRRKILDIAVQRNRQEGQQYITGEMNSQREWMYYNSDYYFKSEAAISAITDGLDQIAQGPAYKDFALPDYKAQGMEAYYNFNSAAFTDQFSSNERFMLDPDQVPPKNFKWFYQSGDNAAMARLVSVHDKDGNLVKSFGASPKSFDPTISRAAITWASYLDDKGNKHIVSANFLHTFSKSDLRNVASLLNFTNGSSDQDAAVNQFLKNLQVYPSGYFPGSRPPAVNLWA